MIRVALQIKKQMVSSRTVTSKGTNTRRYITIHETGNTKSGANAQAHANLQTNGNSRAASWHWQVDDRQAIQSFPHSVICWHAGGGGNSQSIGIEICVNSDGDFTKAVRNAAELVRKIMKDEGIPLSNVVQHNKWSGKNCPENIRKGAKGITWARFKSLVQNASGDVSDAVSVPDMSTPPNFSFHLERGDKGALVRFYQDKLNRAGYPLVLDGSFGPAMHSAVERFQRNNGLVVDGYLGPSTQNKLDEVLRAMREEEKEVSDEMAEKLPETQRKDFEKLMQKAYDDGVFTVNHSDSVKDMTRGRALDLLVSYVSRKENKK